MTEEAGLGHRLATPTTRNGRPGWSASKHQGSFDAPIQPAFRNGANLADGSVSSSPRKGAGGFDLEYEPRDVAEGAAISTIAWTAWWITAFSLGLSSGRTIPDEARFPEA